MFHQLKYYIAFTDSPLTSQHLNYLLINKWNYPFNI